MNISEYSILIVDDNKDICEILYDCFDDYDLKTHIAYSGNEAIEFMRNNKVDFLLTDVKMPNGSGVDLLKDLEKRTHSLKAIIMMTGYTDMAKDHFFELGATHFFQKPIKVDEIIKIIEKFLTIRPVE